MWYTNLFEGLGIEQDPSELDYLGRVLCNIDTVLVTGGGHMDHHVAIDIKLGSWLVRHGGYVQLIENTKSGCRTDAS